MNKPRRGNQDLMRAMNRNLILNIVSSQGPLSRTQLTELSGLSVGAVSQIVNDLLETKWITEAGESDYTGGRRQVMLRLNPTAGLCRRTETHGKPRGVRRIRPGNHCPQLRGTSLYRRARPGRCRRNAGADRDPRVVSNRHYARPRARRRYWPAPVSLTVRPGSSIIALFPLAARSSGRQNRSPSGAAGLPGKRRSTP